MGDAADYATESGMEMLALHNAGRCGEVGPCPYCDEEPAACEYCGRPKVPGTRCRGNDQCIYGPDGKEAECCEGWSDMCCRCGRDYALGQM
jgi:hypothetical protein